MDNVLTFMGLALRAGRLAVGETPVHQALAEGKAKAVFLAQDAGEHTRRKLATRLGEVPLTVLQAEKAQLGHALGRKSAAVAAVTDAGFAQRLMEMTSQSQRQDGGVTI